MDGDVALRLQLVHQLEHGRWRHHFVVFAVHDDPARRARGQEGEIIHVGRRRDRDEALDLRPAHQQLHADPGAKGEAAHPGGVGFRIELLQPIERGGGVGQFADAVIERALAAANTAEVEAQRRKAAAHEALIKRQHDWMIHRALRRVRLQQDGDRRTRAGTRLVTAFETAFGAGKNDFGHADPNSGARRLLRPIWPAEALLQ